LNFEVVGRVYIAEEGINAQIALPSVHFNSFKEDLYTIDFLSGIRLNTAIEENQKAFIKLDMKVRPKIVADGIDDPEFNPTNTGTYLEAEDWNSYLNDEETVVIDMRNHYESEIGHFEGALLPQSETFRDELPEVLDMLKGKEDQKILLYCTGGIRCEKTSAYLKHHGFKDVNQLHGGIIDYARQIKDKDLPNLFHGKNFVFDERLGESISCEVISHCHQCGEPCDHHVNCANVNCNLLFIQCENCTQEMEGCCSQECMDIVHLPEEEQKILRKGQENKKRFHSHQKVELNRKEP